MLTPSIFVNQKPFGSGGVVCIDTPPHPHTRVLYHPHPLPHTRVLYHPPPPHTGIIPPPHTGIIPPPHPPPHKYFCECKTIPLVVWFLRGFLPAYPVWCCAASQSRPVTVGWQPVHDSVHHCPMNMQRQMLENMNMILFFHATILISDTIFVCLY